MFERLVGCIIGGASGALLYLAWQISCMFPSPHAPSLLGSDSMRWFIIGGMLLGLVGGLAPAKWLWSFAVDDVRDESTFAMGAVVFMFLILVLVGVAIKLSA